MRILDPVCCTVASPRYPFAVVEVSAPTGFEDAFGLADEILVISAPWKSVAIVPFIGVWSPLISMLALHVSPMRLRYATSQRR